METSDKERDPFELLAADYMEQLRQGRHPSIEDYAAQHPDLAEEIRELFPTIALTEQLKAKKERSSDGRATLGAAQIERLGDFRIIREIGRGGMGVVFEAEQESLGRRVAVKVLPRQALLDEKHLKRFQREARIAANLHHTNIVEVFGVGEQNGFHYFVMQYIHGVGLDAIVPKLAKRVRDGREGLAEPPGQRSEDAEPEIAGAAIGHLLGESEGLLRNGRLGLPYWRSIVRIGLQAADALSYAHSLGTLHRDIKPANLLLDAQCNIWLADFGLAKAAQSDDVSLSNDIVGTLRYMAPEQFSGEADHRSDIYSLGLTLYELLALRPAYEEANQSRLIQRITQGPPPSPGIAGLGMPADLETIILKAISHDPEERYQSAGLLSDDLRCFLEDRPIRARRAGPAERLGRWCRRNKALASLAGSTLFLLALVAAVASIGYLREARERVRAEASASLAIEAIDRVFERLSPSRITLLPQISVDGLRGELVDAPNPPIVSKEAAALLEDMLPFYDRLARQIGDSGDLRIRTAEANRRVGAIRQHLGQSEEAVKAYRRAIALFKELDPRLQPSINLSLKVAQIQNELGRLFVSQRRADEARDSFLAALSLLQSEASKPRSSPDVRFELARACFFLGQRERPLPATEPRAKAGPEPMPEEQRESLARAVALLKSLSAEIPSNPEYERLLALCYLEGAVVEDDRRQETAAGDERAIEILERLVERFPGMLDYAFDLSEACARLHIPNPPISINTQEKIEKRLAKSLALLDGLIGKHPDVPAFLVAEACIHHKLGSFQRQIDRWADAEQNFRKAVAVQKLLVKQFPEAPYYELWMATFRIALADSLMRCDQPAEARKELDETIVGVSRHLQLRPEMSFLHDLLALGYSQLERTLRQLGENPLADEAKRRAEQERKAVRKVQWKAAEG